MKKFLLNIALFLFLVFSLAIPAVSAAHIAATFAPEGQKYGSNPVEFNDSIFAFSVSVPVFAAVGLPPELRPENLPGATRGQEGAETSKDYAAKGVQMIIGDIISVALLLAGVLAIFSIVNNAWYLIIAAGKSEDIEQRKKGLYWAIIGLVLVILSYIIMRFVVEFVITAMSE